MIPFLKQVASHYYEAGRIDQRRFVFPNRRSRVFFMKYLSECVRGSSRPLPAPQMFTMSDFFSRAAGLETADRVHLLLKLYESYRALYAQAEPLDDFIFWGDVLLGDFDDVDKYLADPSRLFANIADFKGMQDSYSYLSEGQRKAIEQFMEHFHEDGRLTVDIQTDNPDVKSRFLQIWDLLLPLYTRFRSGLEQEGMAYEGMLYRKVADRLEQESVVDLLEERFGPGGGYVFVGLNALNECEKKIMAKMRDAGIAEFCWDYSSTMIQDRRNKSSFFMAENVEAFKPAFHPDPDGLADPVFHVISVPSSVGQAKQLPRIFREIGSPGLDTAVVLPDENLLSPVLNSIPEEIREVNVTMGYPMGGSEWYALMNDIAAMQLHLRQKAGEWYYYHRQVRAIFSNSIFKSVLDEAGREKAAQIRSEAQYYIPQAELTGHPVFEWIFRPVVTDPNAESAGQVGQIRDYLLSVLTGLAPRLTEDGEMALELEFARAYYQSLTRLGRETLPLRPASYFRLLDRVMGGMSVPFRGEPLKGLQVMGPLETRSLDFDHLIILSCNEGIFPHRSVSSSFIPPELRKGFGLPTYEYQDAVWAYYFYRMIQRASQVWLLYDSRTEHMKSGEESRYIKQLELHFGIPLHRCLAKASLSSPKDAEPIPKTDADVAAIRAGTLSATALQNYLACPAKFYYYSVKHLKAETELSESLDAGMIGNVYHKTLHALYEGRVLVTAADLTDMMKQKERIRDRIRGFILEELRTVEVSGRNLVFEDVVFKMVLKTLERDKELLENTGSEGFRILGLEREFIWSYDGFRFRGFVDRLDSYRPGEVRIVDYKTGRVEEEDIHISDENAQEVIDKLFGEKSAKRPKIALQLFLYDMFVGDDPRLKGWTRVNSIYQTSRLFVSPVQSVPLSSRFCELMKSSLSGMLKELADTAVPFRRTEDRKTCAYCDFKTICGR